MYFSETTPVRSSACTMSMSDLRSRGRIAAARRPKTCFMWPWRISGFGFGTAFRICIDACSYIPPKEELSECMPRTVKLITSVDRNDLPDQEMMNGGESDAQEKEMIESRFRTREWCNENSQDEVVWLYFYYEDVESYNQNAIPITPTTGECIALDPYTGYSKENEK